MQKSLGARVSFPRPSREHRHRRGFKKPGGGRPRMKGVYTIPAEGVIGSPAVCLAPPKTRGHSNHLQGAVSSYRLHSIARGASNGLQVDLPGGGAVFDLNPLQVRSLTMTRRLLLQEEESRRIYRITLPCIVGRGEDVDFEFCDPTISHRHAEIWEEEGTVWLRDLKSLNGVYLNEERVKDEVPLSPRRFHPDGSCHVPRLRRRQERQDR